MRFEKLHLEKLGFIGSVVATLCCLGFAPLIAVLSAIGAGFLIHDVVLAPLLIFFLIIGGVGLFLSYRRHHCSQALVIHAISSIMLIFFIFVRYSQPLVWVGIAGLLAASIWNFRLRKRAESCPAASETCPMPQKEKEE